MRKEISTGTRQLPPELEAELLAARDIEPDTVAVPEAPAGNWREARRFHQVRKEPISIRLDADVLAWLRLRHERYQVEINRILRREMEREQA